MRFTPVICDELEQWKYNKIEQIEQNCFKVPSEQLADV